MKIPFNKGTLTVPSIKSATGNIHQRINQRFEIVQLQTFLEKHPTNADMAFIEMKQAPSSFYYQPVSKP